MISHQHNDRWCFRFRKDGINSFNDLPIDEYDLFPIALLVFFYTILKPSSLRESIWPLRFTNIAILIKNKWRVRGKDVGIYYFWSWNICRIVFTYQAHIRYAGDGFHKFGQVSSIENI